ncbi:MAG: hypothetical protein QM786_14705 [Breznakibacter sp.]
MEGDPFCVEVNGFTGILTSSATAALDLALKKLALRPDDEVWIETTSNNRYISGCVTRTIEKHCRWSRKQSPQTAAVLVNHEFGFAYQELLRIKKMGYPLIEDAAYSMFSATDEGPVGTVGDYVLFSLAKMFPMQCGGILVDKSQTIMSDIDAGFASYLKRNYSVYRQNRQPIIETRIRNHRTLAHALGASGFTSRFDASTNNVPGAFVCRAPRLDLDGLKHFMQAQGVECTVFYGEEAFILPCHQNLDEPHLEYFVSLINYFRNVDGSNTNG